MNIIDIWKSNQKPTISFEFLPPKDDKATETLENSLDKLLPLNPDFVSVTFGAGGSTREGSYQLVQKLKKEKKLEVIAYFAGYGLGPDDITKVLDNYKNLGLEYILAVRGDKPHDKDDYIPHLRSFNHASELISFIKSKFKFSIGAACYPEGHIQCENLEKDIEYLKLKMNHGAEFAICNYFYDNKYFFDFIKKCKNIGISIPIIPGIMPIYSIKMMEILSNICGATITNEVHQGLNNLPEGDKQAINDFGINFATKQCKELLKTGVPGLHFYTMNRSSSALEVISNLKKEGLL